MPTVRHTCVAFACALCCAAQSAVSPFLPPDRSVWYMSGANYSPVQVIDANGDGKPDLAVGEIYIQLSSLYPTNVFSYDINHGNGRFTRYTVTEPPAPQPRIFHRVLAIGDVDGNGTEDVFVARSVGPATPLDDALYLNQGNAGFLRASGYLPSTPYFTGGAAFLDADRDGDLDLFLMDIYGPNRLYINDGTGRFTDESAARLPVPTGANGKMVLAFDVDRDGDVDVLVGNGGNNLAMQMPSLYLNDGTGQFQYGQVFTQAGWTAWACLQDMNGDGWTDVVMLDNYPPTILMNQQGTLSAAGITFPPSLRLQNWIGAVDFDGDGDMDLMCMGVGMHVLLENVGNLTFVDATSRMPLGPTAGFEVPILFDLDLDGDLDMLTNGSFYRGTLREVILRNDPTRGATWSIGLIAKQNHMLLLGMSVRPGEVSFPGLGWLWLDTQTSQYLGQMHFGFHYEQSLLLPVPNLPGLLGATVCVQALDVRLSDMAAQFTNAPCAVIR